MNHSKEFKALKRLWYKKLKDSGFEDHESEKNELRSYSSSVNRPYHNEQTRAAKQEYFRLAGQFLYEHEFDNEVERRIWALHCEGISIRNIVKTLEKEKLWFKRGQSEVHVPCKFTVDNRIQKLRKLMLQKVKEENERTAG